MLGITTLKKRIKSALGINAILRPFRAPENAARRAKRQLGYYSFPMKLYRYIRRKS
jgi:hypothetical protein